MMTHDTHVMMYETDVILKEGHHEFKGHRIAATPGANLTSLKNKFVNALVSNIRKRFPEKSLLDSFYVLAMRTINFEKDLATYGVEEVEKLLKYYGEEKSHKAKPSAPVLSKKLVREQWMEVKSIVKSAMYPTDDMQSLWKLLITHHREELGEIIKLGQIAVTLPLHTANCERVFSQQNIILTKQRNRLSHEVSDRLLRIRLCKDKTVDFDNCLAKWRSLKKRIIKS